MRRLVTLLRDGRVATLLSNMALLAVGIATSAIASRVLGPTGRGEYVTWQTWIATLAILALGGVPQVLVLDDRTGERHRLRTLAALLAPALGVGLLFTAVFSAVLRPQWMVTAAAVAIAAATQVGSVAAAEAQRMGRMGLEFNAARSLAPVAGLVAMGALLFAGSSSAPTWLLVIGGLQAIASIVWVVATARRGQDPPGSSRHTLIDAIKLAPGNGVTMLQYRFDLLAVAALFPAEMVAFYATGVAAQTAVLAAGQAHGMNWFSRRNHAATDRRVSRELVRTAVTAATVALPLAATSRWWVPVVYGSEFAPAVAIVSVLCLVGIVQSMDYLLAHECLLAGLGRWTPFYRLPSLATLALGFALAQAQSWPKPVIALLPGFGYALSSVSFLIAVRRRAAATVTPTAAGKTLAVRESV